MKNNLLYARSCRVNDYISVYIPTMGEVLDNEEHYLQLVSMCTAMPIDMMVTLHDAGIDFSTINEYELFLMLFADLKERDTHLLFGNLDLSKFVPAVNNKTGLFVLIDEENGIVIDREIHRQISDILRQIHYFKKDIRQPANAEALEFLIDRERRKMARRKREQSSQFEPLVVAMVNNEQFKYDFETVRTLSVYQFNTSLRQIIKKTDYDNKMYGVYTGSISTKDLRKEDFDWLSCK